MRIIVKALAFRLVLAIVAIALFSGPAFAQKSVHVKGYTKKDGTVVKPYDRAAPSSKAPASSPPRVSSSAPDPTAAPPTAPATTPVTTPAERPEPARPAPVGVVSASDDPQATVTTNAPIYLVPDANRTPLRVAAVNTILRVLENNGDWLKVEFQDPQYGKRVGYVVAANVRVNRVVRPAEPPVQALPQPSSQPVAAAPAVAPVAAPAAVVPPQPVPAREKDTSKVSVFLKGAGTDAGFTDPSKDRQDSVKDLQKKLKDSKAVSLVDSAADAVIVLEVLARETKRETNGWTALSGDRQNKSYLTVKLTAGEYSTEFQGESGSKGMMKGYGAAAGKVVDQLEHWIEANRSRLLQMKR